MDQAGTTQDECSHVERSFSGAPERRACVSAGHLASKDRGDAQASS